MIEQLLTPQQLSKRLQVSVKTIYWWTQIDFIPHEKLGKLVRFSETKVEKWLQERDRKGRRQVKYDVTAMNG